MPIPGFDRHGLLPAGTYRCSMTEVESRFGWNRHRKRFVELLGHFLLREIRPRFAQAFFVNGSFVTDKEEPGDVDVVLDMRAAHDDQKWQALVLVRDRQEQGPALSGRDPTMSIVTSMFSSLRKQIQGIAKSIAGLESDERVRWPLEFEPHLSGIAPGSLIVGLRIQSPDADTSKAQTSIPSLSEPVVQAVRQAVKDIASIGRYVQEEGVDDAITEAFPDPAVRDAVMVAASKLAPTGRRGVEALACYRPDTNDAEARPLTPRSRKVLNSAVKRPVRVSGSGSFVGIVRAIDLDARRFEIRHVQDIGAIRCVYAKNVEESVRKILDTRVRVTGQV